MKKQQVFLSVLAMLMVMLVGGFSVFAAETPVQVTASLSADTVKIAGIVQNSEITEIGVLILQAEADFEHLDSNDIVYANQYALNENGAFSFEVALPSSNLKGYVLQIGGEKGMLYRKLLDGSEFSDSKTESPEDDSSSGNSSTTDSESETGKGDQQSSGVSSGNSSLTSPGSSKESSNVSNVNTGDTQNFVIWVIFFCLSVIALAGIVVIKKKGGNQHE